MTKPPFSCLCTTPAPTLTAVIILHLLFPERTGKRDVMKWQSRIGGGGVGARREGKKREIIKNWLCGWNESKRWVAGCSPAHCTRPLGFVGVSALSQNIFTFIDKINCWQNSWIYWAFLHEWQKKAANSRSQITSLLHCDGSVKKSGRRMPKHFMWTGPVLGFILQKGWGTESW